MNADLPRLQIAPRTRQALIGLAAIGAAAAAGGALMAPDRMWASWLLVAYYALGLGLAGLCFVAIHYTTGASWSAAVRRVPEALVGTLPCSAVLLGAVLVARPQLYSWTAAAGAVASSPALAFKLAWLSRPFFLFRAVTYALIWIGFAMAIRRASLRQDGDGDRRWTRANVRLSAAFLMVFAVTFTLASVDWVMSLEPLWYSTIFGVYNFAGLFLSGLAAIVVVALWLERAGPLRQVLTDDHLHDLGKLLFAFSVFWMYIWFSQYMLIWYTNIPEETAYFVRRTHGVWWVLFLANIVLNWLVPFAVLLRRDAKRSRPAIGFVAVTILVGRWLDLYLMIFPAVVGDVPRLGLWEIGLTAGGFGAFGLVLAWILKGAPAVPLGDPDLVAVSGHHAQG
ncbi:MAG: hypothetical protein ABI868_01445 [Acidobacteriota bacterium]